VKALLGYLNWISPPLIKAAVQRAQAVLIGSLAADAEGSISLVMMPQYSVKAGQLWMMESMALKQLSEHNLNIDRPFMVPYKARLDSRDSRPGTMMGRIVTTLGNDNNIGPHWQHCPLVDRRRTEEVHQLATADMVALEDYVEAPLPSNDTGLDGRHAAVRGPRRFEQIGHDACMKILDSTFDGLGKAPLSAMPSTTPDHMNVAPTYEQTYKSMCILNYQYVY